VVLLALVLPPLVYFVAYFCFLHSPRHLIEAARLVGIGSPEQVIVRALPITCVTVIGAMIAVYLLPSMPLSTATIQVVFIGLAALTVPHMLLVERIARHRRPVAEVP
jgi:Brp/Blh family beta-carotene 15,15'-monooxygenase